MLFSIIVPVYNGEKTIISALQSIIRQNFFDVEIIVVNDGSKDKSKDVIKAYISKNKNFCFKFIDKENGGVSSARISGINASSGEYLAFLDADDCLAMNYFQCLSIIIFKYNYPDCINFKYHRSRELNFDLFEDNKVGKEILLTNKNEIASKLFSRSSNNSLCNKVYKRSTILKADLSKTIGITMGEDRLTNALIFNYVEDFLCIDSDLYQYYENSFAYKHSNKVLFYNDFDSLILLENVIRNLNDEKVIAEIRTHELDKILSNLKTKIFVDKIGFKDFKKYLLSIKNSKYYKIFLRFGYCRIVKTEKLYKTIFRNIKCGFYFLAYILLKLLAKRDNRLHN